MAYYIPRGTVLMLLPNIVPTFALALNSFLPLFFRFPPIQETRSLAGDVTERSKILRRLLKGAVPLVSSVAYLCSGTRHILGGGQQSWCEPSNVEL